MTLEHQIQTLEAQIKDLDNQIAVLGGKLRQNNRFVAGATVLMVVTMIGALAMIAPAYQPQQAVFGTAQNDR